MRGVWRRCFEESPDRLLRAAISVASDLVATRQIDGRLTVAGSPSTSTTERNTSNKSRNTRVRRRASRRHSIRDPWLIALPFRRQRVSAVFLFETSVSTFSAAARRRRLLPPRRAACGRPPATFGSGRGGGGCNGDNRSWIFELAFPSLLGQRVAWHPSKWLSSHRFRWVLPHLISSLGISLLLRARALTGWSHWAASRRAPECQALWISRS